MADIRLIGWQGIVDRLTASADFWRISIIILLGVMVKKCRREMLRDIVKIDVIYTSFSA